MDLARLTARLRALPGGARLIQGAGAAPAEAPAVTGVAHDSRAVAEGDLFCCVPGALADGHEHAGAAVAAGAVALLCERPLDLPVPQIVVARTRPAMGPAADEVYGHPSRSLLVAGVTGTNGKTTTVHLLASILEHADRPAAVIGTLTGARTTPEAPDLQRLLAAYVADGVAAVAMEVSSHALAMHRVDGTRFRVAVFTNLSADHLDFHPTMEDYFQAKARLFTPELSAQAVIDVDDAWGARLAAQVTIPAVTVGRADLDAVAVGLEASTFRWRGHAVRLPIGGAHNVANALVAAEVAHRCGIDPAVIAAGLGRAVVVPGRFELVDAGQPFTVVVDFAHTPDALEHVLAAASAATGGRVHVVFGCGGDRDPAKRGPMGEVAARGADRVVLTADNSRGEPTEVIIAAVRSGFDNTVPRRAEDLLVEPDRRLAIAAALAQPWADVVLSG
ncbi:MAG: UDP-N-acetylmuramoyl-L-alanyl-D-glutamate--2,6-diaminopimelate ligase, partial [Acidimicrobiales bacterium]|nr:UDP-N-acetylmuramoyl-L-alanyl-D-glutamate--2,6-diaminopimelate ligase [Acidimicrobiales bacterium]